MDDKFLLDIFKDEARELLQKIESDIITLEEDQSSEVINSLFRNFHTIKGSSGIVGLKEVSEFTHYLENLLDKSRSNLIEIDSDYIDLLLKSADWLKVSIFNENSDENIYQKELLINDLVKYDLDHNKAEEDKDKDKTKEKKTSFSYFRIKINLKPDIFEYGIDPLIIIEELMDIGDIVEKKVNKENLPSISEMDPERYYLNWFFILKTKCDLNKINDVFLFIEGGGNTIEIDEVTDSYIENNNDLPYQNRKLGDILVKKGIVTSEELDYILKTQEVKNKRLGDILIDKNLLTKKDLDMALGIQKELQIKDEKNTIRVETNKLDVLMNLLGEIVIAQSSLSGLAELLDDEKSYEVKNTLYNLERSTREFQENIMAIRMVPIGPTFNQFKRFVRDISQTHNKEIKLNIEGGETELDKTVIERITDPLKHMIRNSIDHGIESTDERLSMNKTAFGNIFLNAYHQEGKVFIEITDDGRGIDFKKIKEESLKKGIISPDKELSEKELKNLIFLPGFSTAKDVGDLSGRGVGMDVVKNNIESLNGIIELTSNKGNGTTIIIKLPLTLAIIEGMLVRIGNQVYIIPLLSIVESVRPDKKHIKTVENKGELIYVREEYISLIRLSDYLKIDSDFSNPWEALVVIVESEGEKVGLMIDDLIGQQQIVIKSLDSGITNNSSISGAAILGDGTVSLILDIYGLLKAIRS